MRFSSFRASAPFLLTLLALSGCDGGGSADTPEAPSSSPSEGGGGGEDGGEGDGSGEDDGLDEPDSPVEAAPTVLNVRLRAVAGDVYSISDIDRDGNPHDDYAPEMQVYFSADDYPDLGTAPNAMLRIRGNTSRMAPQKSYRVKLNKGAGLWRGEQVLQLNKHPFDLTRVRNKLAFDLLRGVPHLSTLRTQFVHVTFDDDANPATPYVDYGLFTHVEKLGREYLVNRGYATTANLYKAEDFAFRPDSRLEVTGTGEPRDKARFERVLEIENGSDHRALLRMIEAINDDGTDFDAEFKKYFSRKNYLSWLAANILLGNHDTVNQNFALYQPADGERFYLVPWDCDGALGFEDQPDIVAEGSLYDEWELGLSNWWGVPLHRRFLQQPGNLEALIATVQELHTHHFSHEKIKARIDSYRPLVETLITTDPDLQDLPTVAAGAQREKRKQEWANEYQRLTTVVDTNYSRFMALLEKPMPFWQAAEVIEGRLLLSWDQAVDLRNEAVTYKVEVATRPDFSAGSLRFSQDSLASTRVETVAPPAGTYYMRVTAMDPHGHVQRAFDRTEQGRQVYFGVMEFAVP